MREIPVGRLVAIVDDADYERVKSFAWYLKVVAHCRYAYARMNGQRTSMHRFLMDAPKTDVDHVNGDGLDNRRANLRHCTTAQNKQNSRKRSRLTSQFKGVHWDARKRRWRTQIAKDGRQRQVGLFASETHAAHAYDAAAREQFGEFAHTNF